MQEEEFKERIRSLRYSFKYNKIDDPATKAAFISGWIGAGTGDMFTAEQVSQLFELIYKA